MDEVFLTLVNRSLAATWLVAAVLVLRFLLRKAPKWTRVGLWALVAVRLVCSLSIPSPWSAFNLVDTPVGEDGTVEYLRSGMAQDREPFLVLRESEPVDYDSLAISGPRDAALAGETVTLAQTAPLRPLTLIWLAGMTGMLVYAIICYVNLRRRTAVNLPLGKGVYACDRIDTPFILGVFRPRICLPSALEEPQRGFVLAHERAHLARRDHWWKPLGYALLAVYWFNPALWLAYILLCRDIELACDERVFRDMGLAERADYSQALLEQSRPGRAIAACPVAFGEVGVRERVKAALNYKKPAFWIVALAVIACAAAAVCFLTNPKAKEEKPAAEKLNADYTLERAKADGCLVMENGTVTAGKRAFLDFLAAGSGASLRIVNYYTLDDPSRYGAEYYAEHKDDYPALYVHELSCDGNAYTYRGQEDGEEYVRRYDYLLRFADEAESPSASYRYYVRYVLCNEADVTWNRLVSGMLSSRAGDAIDFTVVYQEYLDKSPLTTLTLGDEEAFLAAHAEPPYQTEGTVFTYHGESYDLAEQIPAVNAIAQVRRAGRYYVIEGHVNPNNSVYCVFDTETERFAKTLAGANLTWQGDDLATAVYSFWNEILDYEGNTIAVCDLAEGEYIYSLGCDDDGTVLAAIMSVDGTLREERCSRSDAPVAQAETPPAVYAAAPAEEPAVEPPAEPVEASSAESAEEPENSMVVVVDLSEYEGGEEP